MDLLLPAWAAGHNYNNSFNVVYLQIHKAVFHTSNTFVNQLTLSSCEWHSRIIPLMWSTSKSIKQSLHTSNTFVDQLTLSSCKWHLRSFEMFAARECPNQPMKDCPVTIREPVPQRLSTLLLHPIAIYIMLEWVSKFKEIHLK